MDQQRYEEIRKASKRLAEANTRVDLLRDDTDLKIIFEDAVWPAEVKARATEAAKAELRSWAATEQSLAQSAWEAL